MMHPTRPPVNDRFAATRTDEVDTLLRRFYRAELPSPWPAAPDVVPLSKETPRPGRLAFGQFFRAPRRLALAASVALLVTGYLTLQSWFPDPRLGSDVDTSAPTATRPGIHNPMGHRPQQNPDQGGKLQTSPHDSWLLPVHQLPAKK